MKVINVITPHYTPEITAAAHRIDAVVSTLATEFKVNVFTLTERGKKASSPQVQIADNVTVHSINLPGYTKSLFFIRALYELYYSIKVCRRASKTEADITFVTSPYMFLLPVATMFAGKSKLIADVRDLVWCYLPNNNFIQNLIRSNFEKLVSHYITYYDHVTVTNKSEKKWLLENTSLQNNKITILSNGISVERFERLCSLKYHSKNDPFVITYVGNIGNGQDLQPLVDTVKNLEGVKLNIIGDGIEFKKFGHQIKTNKITNIQLHGKLKWNRILPFYQSSSVLYARLGENYNSAIPSKLFEYLSTGLPVVFHGTGAAKEFLGQFESTFIVEDRDQGSLEEVLLQLKKTSPNHSQMNREMIASHYLRGNINRNLFPIIEYLLAISTENPIKEESVPLILQEDVI